MQFKDENLTILPVFLNPEDQKNNSLSSSTQNLETGTKRTIDSALEETNSGSTLKYKKEILSLMFDKSQKSDLDYQKLSNIKKSKIDESINSSLDILDEPQDNQMMEDSSSNRKSSPSRGNNEDSLRDKKRKLFPKRLPKSQPSFTSVAYICKGPDYKGKFDPLAAKALGLEPGRQYCKSFFLKKIGSKNSV
jgi:hypothetical protein